MSTLEFQSKLKKSLIATALILLVSAAFLVPQIFAADTAAEAAKNPEVSKFAVLAAALAFIGGALGAGFAVGHVGSAAMGAISEKPEVGSQALIFVALGEGLVVFGFITALIILGKA